MSSKPKSPLAKTKTNPRLISIKASTEAQKKTLHPFSNSRLVDMNQCPMWGVVHSQRQYATNARAMALEAGEVMHQVFAAVRIWQLEHVQKLPKHAKEVAKRIFGLSRWDIINREVDYELSVREQLLQLAFATLHSSEFYDDPNDSTRTISNMELAAIHYVDLQLSKMHNWPIWVEDVKNPKCRVGIEQVFDVVLTYSDKKQIRYIGTIDGLVVDSYRDNLPTLDENKTASRLDEGWINSFDMAHQITGYLACSTAVFGISITHARVTGLKIKISKRGDDDHVKRTSRDPATILHWASWVRHTVELYETYKDNFEDAPRYTHSCNRYFRPCSLLTFCGDTAEGRIEQFASMVPVEGSPSERAVRET